jgi:hypothetical protein
MLSLPDSLHPVLRLLCLLPGALLPTTAGAVEDAYNASRIAEVTRSPTAVTVTAVLDPYLDLASRLGGEAETVKSPVPLGPAIVAGQGNSPENLTFVRVLNQHGIRESQFLAYPDSVRGGVRVAAGRDREAEVFIVTAPIEDSTVDTLRVFDAAGGLRALLRPPQAMRAPFLVAVGAFGDPGRGDAIAIAPAKLFKGQAAAVLLYSPEGEYLDALRFTSPGEGPALLETAHVKGPGWIDLSLPETGQVLSFDTRGGDHDFTELESVPGVDGLFRSAFGEDVFWAPLEGRKLSEALTLSEKGPTTRLNLGRHENEFWINGSAFGFEKDAQGEYIKFARYGHQRTDASSPAYRDPEIFSSADPQDWDDGTRSARAGSGRLNESLNELPRTLWEPCFTHRQFNDRFDAWEEAVDQATGLPKYLMLSRKNAISYYGEFGQTNSFVGSTYAFGLPALDRLYRLPLRAFLFSLSEAHREYPERMISLEPNHEHEISVKEDASVGDYNPTMISGFREFLKNLYDADLATALKLRRGPKLDAFDAPRNSGRGSWDAYDLDNAFFRDWIAYNRYVVNRRIADTFTESLLAGFPSGIIKSHQIPDAYAIGTLDLFSERAVRITPIDYALSAGVGFGFTRYSVWYKKDNHAFKAGFSSGFDSIVLGEYQALTGNQNDADDQLVYLWENGANAIHAMKWPESHDRGFNETMRGALQNLLDNYDKPRPGVTGGVGQIKAFVGGNRKFNIAAIGKGPDRRGLIKSLNAEAGWEGSVYAVPFRTRIGVKGLPVSEKRNAAGERVLEVGPIQRLDGGEQVVLRFNAVGSMEDRMRFDLRHEDGNRLPGYGALVDLSKQERDYGFVLRAQMPAEDLFLSVTLPSACRISEPRAQLETDAVARPHLDQHEGTPHTGGVSFDWF